MFPDQRGPETSFLHLRLGGIPGPGKAEAVAVAPPETKAMPVAASSSMETGTSAASSMETGTAAGIPTTVRPQLGAAFPRCHIGDYWGLIVP